MLTQGHANSQTLDLVQRLKVEKNGYGTEQ